jgi:hypothetical protein
VAATENGIFLDNQIADDSIHCSDTNTKTRGVGHHEASRAFLCRWHEEEGGTEARRHGDVL